MNWINRCYHFLGSITFAITLIGFTALMVVAGTLLESATDSHLYAAQWTYQHPLFIFLLWLFFINILFSATRRWPFKRKHIPFLITHLGLLMIIGGTIVKNQIGLQGHLSILEGSGSQQVLLPHSHSLHIEKRDGNQMASLDLPVNVNHHFQSYRDPSMKDLSIKIIGFYPHVSENMQTWIKDQLIHISGQSPFRVVEWKKDEPLPNLEKIVLDGVKCHVIALKTDDLSDAIKKCYLHQFDLNHECPLLVFIGEELFAFDQNGHVYTESFEQSNLKSLIVYDQGFGGYAVQAILPFKSAEQKLVIETPLTMQYLVQKPPTKLEDHHSCILLEVREGSMRQKIALDYHPTGAGIKWPALGGRYMMRFQPQVVEIPYRLRLRQARKIHYPGTQQPYSYECDILITDRGGEEVEKTLSMNRVHETWDGYRFYLAGMNGVSDQEVKRVQIVVNHDPAKYWLTYPGAALVFLGIILLFWVRPYRKR